MDVFVPIVPTPIQPIRPSHVESGYTPGRAAAQSFELLVDTSGATEDERNARSNRFPAGETEAVVPREEERQIAATEFMTEGRSIQKRHQSNVHRPTRLGFDVF